jgi:prolyl 3-hydroxylase /prolyl 3,4-dihydroxylase
MVRTHERSPSPTSSADSLLKRLKTTHTPSHDSDRARNVIAQFADGVLSDPGNIQKLHTIYTANEPFKYCVLDKLFQDGLLRNVKDECLKELSFTEKETDIYKVRVGL